jgi:hypothetical protein
MSRDRWAGVLPVRLIFGTPECPTVPVAEPVPMSIAPETDPLTALGFQVPSEGQFSAAVDTEHVTNWERPRLWATVD